MTTFCGSDLLNGTSQKPLLCKALGQSGLADDRSSEV